jgi:hypothetical protein
MGWFLKRPSLRVRKPFSSVRVGPVRVRRGGGSVSAGPVGYSWRKKRRKG